MSEEVTKVIENIDELFPEIVVNGESHVSSRYVAPEPTPSQSLPQTSEEDSPSSTPQQTVQGGYVDTLVLNNTEHDLKDTPLSQEVVIIQQAINVLQGRLNELVASVGSINSKIPAQASSTNQLADKSYVNNSISTNTANFLGTYETLEEIEAIPDPTNNDYAFLETTTASQLQYDRYKYNSEEDEWLFEYSLIFPIGSGGGLAFSGTRAQYDVAKLIPEGEEGFIPEGAFVDITDENDYVKAEEHTNE